MLFEEFGFQVLRPGRRRPRPAGRVRKILHDLKDQEGPLLLARVHHEGAGRAAAAEEDLVTYHTPPVFEQVGPNGEIIAFKKGGGKAYTDTLSTALHQAMQDDPTVTVMTAAMCQGNKLEKVRSDFPERFFDVGICESHAVAFAAGMAKAAAAAGGGHLQHLPAAVRSTPRSSRRACSAEPAGGVLPGPGPG